MIEGLLIKNGARATEESLYIHSALRFRLKKIDVGGNIHTAIRFRLKKITIGPNLHTAVRLRLIRV